MVVGSEHIAESSAVAANYLRYVPLAPLVGSLLHMTVGARLGRSFVNLIACAVVSFLVVLTLKETAGKPLPD